MKLIGFQVYFHISFSVLAAVGPALGNAELCAWIWTTINTQMKDVLLLGNLTLWRTATRRPAPVHRVRLYL